MIVDETDWFIVFNEGTWDPKAPWVRRVRFGWWRPFLRRGFRHVWCVRWDGWNWLAVNATYYGTDCWVEPFDEETWLPGHYVEQGSTVLHVKAVRVHRYIPQSVIPCVGTAKRLLGIRSAGVVTPYGLFRYLKRGRNGLEVAEVRGVGDAPHFQRRDGRRRENRG